MTPQNKKHTFYKKHAFYKKHDFYKKHAKKAKMVIKKEKDKLWEKLCPKV